MTMTTDKVWIVFRSYAYEDAFVEAVCLSEQRANEIMAEVEARYQVEQKHLGPASFCVEEYDIAD